VGLILSLAGLPAISLAAAVTLTEKPAVLSPASLEVLGPVLPVMPPSPIPPSPPAQPEEEQPAVIQRGADTQAVTGGVIAGTIKLANGAPAAEMRVTAIAVEHGGIVAGAFTDRNGRYRLEGLRVGSFYVSVGPIPASGYVLPTPPPATESLLTYYPGVPRQQDARPVKIAEGAIVEDLNFSIERPLFAVTGKIIPGFPGQQRPKAVFLLTLNGAMEARIADGGEFVFPNVLPGQYNLRPGSPIVGADRLITVNEDIRGLELTLPPAVYVAGRIVVERSANGFPGFQLTVSRGNDRYSIMRFPMGPNGNIGGGGGGGGTSDETRLMVDFNHQDNSLNSHLMSALPGEYRLSVEPLSPDFEVKSVTYAGVKVTGDTFTVASEDSEGLVITIAPKAGTGR
jgi:hypothetical protein